MAVSKITNAPTPPALISKVNEIIDNLGGSSGGLAYTATCPAITISDGLATWSITHNLGTQTVITELYTSSGAKIEHNTLITSNNAVTISFKASSNVAAGDYKIVILASGGTVSGADTNLSNITNTGKSVIAHDAMPSNTFENLTVSASGTEYTAPADGWFFVVGGCAGSGANFLAITNTTTGISRQDQLWDTYGNQKLLLPVNKGEKAKLEYGNVRFYDFKFYYTNGTAWEVS